MQRLKQFVSLHRYLLFCFFVFFLAQLLYSAAHAGFYTNYYTAANQVGINTPQLALFRQHFITSLWYYHINPPLYSFYSYLFIILFPPQGELGIYVLHTLLGLTAVYSLFSLFARFKINVKLAAFLIAAFVLSPTFNLSQTKGWYDFPTFCLLITAAWRLICMIDTKTWKNASLFFLVIALLCSIRSLYHVLFYYVPLIIVSTLVLKKQWKMVLLSSLLPFLFVFSCYFKNYYLFRAFTINSFSGEVLANATMQQNVTLQQRYEGIKAGFFSDLALCPQSADTIPIRAENFAYTGYFCYNVIAEKYRQQYITELGTNYADIPILQSSPIAILKQRNTLGNIGMDKEYQRIAIQSLLHYPDAYFKTVKSSWHSYFIPYPAYYFENMVNIRHLDHLLKRNIFSYVPGQAQTLHAGSQYVSLIYVVMLPFLVFYGLMILLFSQNLTWFLSKCYFAGVASIYAVILFSKNSSYILDQAIYVERTLYFMLIACALGSIIHLFYRNPLKRLNLLSKLDYAQRLTVIFMLCTIVYTTIMVIYVAGNEQLRYRIYIDPFYLFIFGLFANFFIPPKGGHKRIASNDPKLSR